MLEWVEKRFGGEYMFKNPEYGLEKRVMPRGHLESQGIFDVSQKGPKILTTD